MKVFFYIPLGLFLVLVLCFKLLAYDVSFIGK
jgi:hypothetical protein